MGDEFSFPAMIMEQGHERRSPRAAWIPVYAGIVDSERKE